MAPDCRSPLHDLGGLDLIPDVHRYIYCVRAVSDVSEVGVSVFRRGGGWGSVLLEYGGGLALPDH